MRNINLIHISDLHMDSSNTGNLKSIIKSIIEDLKKQDDFAIDMICFTGDIINSGQNDGELYNVAIEHMITPIMEATHLEKTNFFACQGNHENDLSLFDDVVYEGMNSYLKDENKFKKLWQNNKIFSYVNKSTENFNRFLESINNDMQSLSKLTSCAIRNYDDYSIGIVILNSSWRSCGESEKDYGNLIIGACELERALNKIADTDFKIAMFHHPIEYICEIDRVECEKLLNKFDLILNGHTHNPEQFQKFSDITNTVYLTAGQLNDTSGYRNGYTIIEINPFTKEVTTTFRKYFSKRNCFDISSEENETGKFVYNLKTDNNALKEAYNISKNLISYYEELLKKKLITNLFYSEDKCRYIEPYIKNNSEFTEFTTDEDEKIFTIDEILSNHEKYSLFGKANYGKSTTLKILAHTSCLLFEKYRKCAVFIDLNCFDFNGKNQILRAIKKFINKTCDYKKAEESLIEEMLEDNYMVLLIDNFDITEKKHTKVIEDFVEKYPTAQLIITQQEDILDYYNFERIFENFKGFERLYIQPVKKIDIIEFAERYTEETSYENIYSIIDKTTGAISELGMGKTPFNIIMLMNIYGDDSEYTVINEANVVERFMELLLEKVNFSENSVSTFDFRNKEDFLISLAKYMHENNSYVISLTEYNGIIENFFEPVGLDYHKSKFDILFFEKRVLLQEDGEVSFSYKFILEYYIAKTFIKHGLPKDICKNYNYLKYSNELNYYSGINREINELFEKIEIDIQELLNKYNDDIQHEKEYNIDLPIKFTAPQRTLTVAQKSELTDRPDKSQNYNPHDYKKHEYTDSDNQYSGIDFSKEAIISILNIYGRLIRNMDYLPIERKITSINNCINCCCIILNQFCEYLIDTANQKYVEIKENLELDDNIEDVDKFINDSISMLKMVMPIAIESMLFEWIGNKKLLPIFDAIHKRNEYSVLGDFFFSSLYMDLKSPSSYEKIRGMIKYTGNESILKLIYAKLISIYMTTTSAYEEKKVEELIIDLVIKQNPPKRKGTQCMRINKNNAIQNLRDKKKDFLSAEI